MLDDVDPAAIREKLAQSGIVNGEVVDEDALDNSPFIRQVTVDADKNYADNLTKTGAAGVQWGSVNKNINFYN